MDQNHYRVLEKAYLTANINRRQYPGSTISISEGATIISWVVSEDFHHGMDALHGSVYFKLLDDACFFAVNSGVPDVFVLTTSFDLDFLRPVQSGELKATGHVIHSSRNLWVARAELVDTKNRVLATGTGRFVKSKIPLPKN